MSPYLYVESIHVSHMHVCIPVIYSCLVSPYLSRMHFYVQCSCLMSPISKSESTHVLCLYISVVSISICNAFMPRVSITKIYSCLVFSSCLSRIHIYMQCIHTSCFHLRRSHLSISVIYSCHISLYLSRMHIYMQCTHASCLHI